MKWPFFRKKKDEQANLYATSTRNALSMELESASESYYIAQGKQKSSTNDLLGALSDLSVAIEINPNSAEAYMERSKVKLALKDDRGGKQDLQMAGVLLDKLDAAFTALDEAGDKYESEDYNEAARLFTKAIELGIDTSSPYYYRGISKQFLQDYKGALQDYSKAIEKGMESADVYLNRGRAKHKIKDFSGAIADFDIANNIAPTDEIYISRAMANTANGDFEEALLDYNQAIELKPDCSEAYYHRGIRYCAGKEYSKGLTDLERALDLGIADGAHAEADIYALMGSIRLITSDYDGAITDYTSAISLKPIEGSYYFSRGEAFGMLGDDVMSYKDKIKALQLGYEEE